MKLSTKVDEIKSQGYDVICQILAEGGELDLRMRGSSEQAISKLQAIMGVVMNVDMTVDGLTSSDWREVGQ